MSNPHKRCEICKKRHSPGPCPKPGCRKNPPDGSWAIHCNSMGTLVDALVFSLNSMVALVERMPGSAGSKEIARAKKVLEMAEVNR